MKWNDLTMKERAELMSLFLDNEVSSLDEMRHIYNGIEDTVPMEVDGSGNLIDSISPAVVSESLTKDQWNDLYRQGKVNLSDIPRKYQPWIEGNTGRDIRKDTKDLRSNRGFSFKDTVESIEDLSKDVVTSSEFQTALDFVPGVGDVKGIFYDPYIAYKNGGIEDALGSLLLGFAGVIPGGDALKFMKKVSIKEAAEYLRRMRGMGIGTNVSAETVQEILNKRVDDINESIADRLTKGERISISGNRGLDTEEVLDTYNKEGNIGYIQVQEGADKNGVTYIKNISDESVGHHVPDQTIYGLDAARQFSNSKGKSLISGKHLLEPEKTLKGHRHLLFRELPEQGLFDSRNLQDYVARRHNIPDRRDIIHDINDPETIANLNPAGNGTGWAANSYPMIFNDLPIERNGITTYLKDPRDSWVLNYMDDRPGFYQREILGIKEPGRYPHTVYSRFPDVRSFDEKVLTPDDMTYGMNFGIFEFRNGGELKPATITEKVGRKWDNFWWQKVRKPKDFSDEVANTPDCARWSNAELRKRGYNIWGDAWTRSNNRAKKIFSGYDGLERPEEYSYGAYKDYVLGAADNVKKNFDWRDLKEGDIVGLYFRGSPNYQKAFLEGANGEAQTHTGHVVYRKGKPYIAHNVHGDIVLNKAKRLIGRKHPYGIVSVYRPY